MKLAEFFDYIKPTEVISIVDDEFGIVVDPIAYQDLKYIEVYEVLDANIIQVSYDHDDNSLTITIAFDDE
jgi:hypothetical protein